MKYLVKYLVVTVLLFGAPFSRAFGSVVEQLAVPVMVKAVLLSSLTPTADPSCPASGSEIISSVEKASAKAISSSKTILDLVNGVDAQRAKLRVDSSHCGVCKQVNVVSTYTTSSPNQLRTDITCGAPFVRNFQHDFVNQDIESYVSDILRGKNPEGSQILNDCPKTCNLYTASAETPLTSSTSRLNLTILCGPPRQGSIVFATYDFSVGFIHQWSCSK